MKKSNIVLIGFMGTGKTTVGKIISEKIGYKFVDTDEEIEKTCNMSISEIFSTKGEQYFREIERNVVYNVSNYNKAVIACGGGIVKNTDNVEELRKSSLIVCLKADPEIIYSRISSGNTRPLILEKSKDDILNLINEREQLYSIADVFIDTSEYSPLIVSEKVIKIFKMQKRL